MFYLMNFDSRQVQAKSEDNELLAAYILDNDLSLAVALISNVDELCLELSLDEMCGILKNIGSDHNRKDYTEESASESIIDQLEIGQDNIPDFTKALGKKLLKGDKEPTKATRKSSTKPKPSISCRAKDLEGMTFTTTDKPTRPGTVFHVFAELIDENFEQATFDELITGFMENYKPSRTAKVVDDKCARAYLKDAFKGGYIEETL